MIKLKHFFLIVLPFFLLLNCFGQKPPHMGSSINVVSIDHQVWDNLLRKYVDGQGNVDYKGFASDGEQLNTYLEYLTKNPIAKSAPKEEKLAYYINLYNAGTVQLILEHYPLKSIKDIFRPWGKDRIKIGDESFSLGEIEHDILRKMNEPRIHFAINCASFSCPKLRNEAYEAANLENQLQEQAIDFINDTSKNLITDAEIRVSSIFKWFKGDFTKQGDLYEYLDLYNSKINKQNKITFEEYDWSLNEELGF